MAYTNSPLVSVTKISPNKNSPRNHEIDTITIHCYVGQVSVERGLNGFADPKRQASCNYIIGTDGRIGLCVDEKDRSWCSSNSNNDHRAVTIECASDASYPYAFNDAVMKSLKELVVDICKRNNIEKLVWSTSKTDRVNHKNGCNMTCHRDFAAKSCPGDWFYAREGQFAIEVNEMLKPKEVAAKPPAQTQQPIAPQTPTPSIPTEKPYKYVNSDGYIINVFDIKDEWSAWFAACAPYNKPVKVGETVDTFCLAQKADLCTNLALFNFGSFSTVSYVRTSQYQEVGYGGTEEQVEINWANKCSGYAVGIKNGVVYKSAPGNRFLGGSSCRNGIGMTADGRLIIAQSIYRVGEKTFINKVNSYVPSMFGTTVKLFLLEDGGGSTSQYSAISRLTWHPMENRRVATVTCLKRKDFPKVTRTLKKGNTGWDVMRLQMVLGGICTDGSFGAGTESRVKQFQKKAGLAQTGVADTMTLKALGLM